METGLFLGAGASVPYGKPVTKTFKSKLAEKYTDISNDSDYFLKGLLNYSEFEDIEFVLQSLKDIEKFINSDRPGPQFVKALNLIHHNSQVRYSLSSFQNSISTIQRTIENEIFHYYSWDHSHDTDLGVLSELLSIMMKSSNQLNVFTTNYDRAIEEYCDQNDIFCIDGFENTPGKSKRKWKGSFGFDAVSADTIVSLHKLHGSLNWKIHKKYGLISTDEEHISNDPNIIDNMVVYPTLSPKDALEKEPLTRIRNSFNNKLQELNSLMIVGYSFRDEHVNKILLPFMNDGSKKVIVISPSLVDDLKNNLNFQLESEFDSKFDEGNISFDIYGKNHNVLAVPYGIPFKPELNIIHAIQRFLST